MTLKPLNRRHFIQAAANCAAITALPGPLLAAAATKPRLPIGLLGVTHSHGAEKLRLLLKSPDFEVVGVWEEDAAARKTCEQLEVKLLSREALLERSRVVAVEGPVRDHARHALLALRAGKHVHVEKPPAVNLKDLQEMVALARDKKLILQTGYMWRHHPGFDAIIEAARQGWLGEIFMVRANIANNLAPARRPDWAEFPGGGMFELGSHLVDAVVRLLGRPKAVTPFVRHHARFNDELKDNNMAVLEFDRALAVITNTAMQATANPARGFEVLGTNGSAVLQPIEPPTLKLELVKAAGPYQKGSQTIPLTYTRYEADFVELAAVVRGERSLSVSLDEDLIIQETLLKASGMS